jgi:predicted Zn finger-like uncharacterized protein
MILTCPACDTKYVVKDGAIPPGGRQVRCASCKHSWHQDPDEMPAEPATAADIDLGGPPPPQPDMEEQPLAEAPAEAEASPISLQNRNRAGRGIAMGAISSEPVASDMPLAMESSPEEVAMEEAPAVATTGAAHRRPMALKFPSRHPPRRKKRSLSAMPRSPTSMRDRNGAGR